MDDDQRALRRAQITELLLALQEAFEKLDQLEKRIEGNLWIRRRQQTARPIPSPVGLPLG
jgi:hypothetical protein